MKTFSLAGPLCTQNWIGLIHHIQGRRMRRFFSQTAHRISETLIHYVLKLWMKEHGTESGGEWTFIHSFIISPFLFHRSGLYVVKYLSWGFSLLKLFNVLLVILWKNFKKTDNNIAEELLEELSAFCLGSRVDGSFILSFYDTFIDIGSRPFFFLFCCPFFIALLSFSSNIFCCVYFIYI